MIDDERTENENAEQAASAPPNDALEDLDVTTDESADVKAGGTRKAGAEQQDYP